MAVYNKYEAFVEDLANKVHLLWGDGDALQLLLSNTLPNAVTHRVRADAAELTPVNAYAPADVLNVGTRAGGVVTVQATDVAWVTSGPVGPFRYVILFNATAVGGPLIAWWDHGAPVQLAASDSYTVDFGGNALFTIT